MFDVKAALENAKLEGLENIFGLEVVDDQKSFFSDIFTTTVSDSISVTPLSHLNSEHLEGAERGVQWCTPLIHHYLHTLNEHSKASHSNFNGNLIFFIFFIMI